MKLHFGSSARLAREFVMMGLVLGALTSVANVASAADRMQEVMEVTTDAVSNFQYRFAITTDDQGDMTGMAYYPVGGTPILIPLEKMKNEEIVLIHDNEHDLDVVTLSGPRLDAQHGGEARIIFLQNGIRKTYRYFPFQVVRSGAHWELHTLASRGRHGFYFAAEKFTHMFMKANKLFGKVIGISYINVR